MNRPGRRIVSVYRKGPRNRDGDAQRALVATYGNVSVQMAGTGEDNLNGQAERALSSWTLVLPHGADVLASDEIHVHDYNGGGRELRLAVDGHPHTPQFRSGKKTNVIVRAKEVDTV